MTARLQAAEKLMNVIAEPTKLPLVYVRGFAGDTSGINSVVEDPFYGFNEGSTHVRVGADNQPSFHQFESPLLRLHLDEGYKILVEGGQGSYLQNHDRIPPDSVWIHRFYDPSATTWSGEASEFRLEDAASDLLRLIDTLKAKSGAPRVHLVAHSMGGLICRCLVQKVLPDLGRDPADCVDKLFTYGTPHGGIAFDVGFGLLEKVRDAVGINGADIFGPRRMYEYLTPAADTQPDGPPDSWNAREMPDGSGSFPKDRVFCLVGTNPHDYEVAHGLSAATVGARSDGLVQIENARVPGAHTAFVHRSHSGRYGLVNSEEGYQNLRRFLFGDQKVEASLTGHRLPPAEDGVAWQAEVRLSVRGLPIVMHERLASHWCPIQLPGQPSQASEQEAAGEDSDGAVALTTAFLGSALARPSGSPAMRYALHLRILTIRERRGILLFNDHLEQAADFDDILIVDIGTRESGPGIWAAWNSTIPGAIRDLDLSGDPLSDEDPRGGMWIAHIPVPQSAWPILGEGANVRLSVSPWS
ncbi:alpha/beta fold hydrolase [Streptomyces sp. NPDC060209]|uniref:alpha/beta fold hydrolase n=1 Tax=Streptomyces sp. NPDC060209 TaxID=3347073 RepID=UPI003666C445